MKKTPTAQNVNFVCWKLFLLLAIIQQSLIIIKKLKEYLQKFMFQEETLCGKNNNIKTEKKQQNF